MTPDYTRRALLGAAGGAGMAVVIGACGSDDQAGETAATATPEATATVASASGAVALLDNANSCTAAPETTQGPYYFDADRVRTDIREDREGVLMRLALRVQQGAECTPVKDAVVSIWHCDALGSYSGFEEGGGAPDRRPAAAAPMGRRRRHRKRSTSGASRSPTATAWSSS